MLQCCLEPDSSVEANLVWGREAQLAHSAGQVLNALPKIVGEERILT